MYILQSFSVSARLAERGLACVDDRPRRSCYATRLLGGPGPPLDEKFQKLYRKIVPLRFPCASKVCICLHDSFRSIRCGEKRKPELRLEAEVVSTSAKRPSETGGKVADFVAMLLLLSIQQAVSAAFAILILRSDRESRG